VADFVRPEFRARGIGRALHFARFQLLAEHRTKTAFAWVSRGNVASLACLHACGFSVIADEQAPTWLRRPAPAHLLVSRDLT
jgi:L-amino acid N-acyltransferase YncA